MSSDNKRIERDIFGDDDEDEDELTQSRDHDYNDRASQDDARDGHSAAEKDANQIGEEQEEQDEEEEDIQLPSFKKRNADGESPAPEMKKKKPVKKPKPAGDGARDGEVGEELPLDPRQQALLQLEKDFELALKSGKSTTRRRRKDEEDIDSELDEGAQRFVAKMREAAFSDIDSKLKNQSALAKVRMLESVKRQLNKYAVLMMDYAEQNAAHSSPTPTNAGITQCLFHDHRSHVHNTFLDNGILEAMKVWLEPLQDASLPSLDIIQDFMDILDVLPIQTDHLVNSGVGRVVFFYTKVDESRITPSIKRKAESLVDKWSRPIIKLSQDYRDKKINYADEDPVASSSQRRRQATSSSSGALDAPEPKRMGVRVPQIDRGSYALMPESSVVYDKSRGGKSDKYKKLKSHMAKMKQVKRT
ncbi:Transcription factor iws1 [Mortierella sp. GBA30]|nr:Transcription factor iws1 [Mortierella sp. GBA30]